MLSHICQVIVSFSGLVLVLSAVIALPARAQQPVEGASFSLQASISERPHLSRSEVNPAAVGASPAGLAPSAFGGATVIPVDPAIALNISPLGGEAPKAYRGEQWPARPQKPHKPLQGKVLAASSQAPKASKVDAFDELYCVDWSLWITQLADRWYYNLKRLEMMNGRDFHSPRAAQIRFSCYPNGTIGNISLEQSSGIPAYDQMQIQALVQTMPLAPFPPGTQRKSVTLVQGWESHPRKPGEQDYQPGSFGQGFPQEKVNRWTSSR